MKPCGDQHRVEQPDVLGQVVDDEDRGVVGLMALPFVGRARDARTWSGSSRTLIGFSR